MWCDPHAAAETAGFGSAAPDDAAMACLCLARVSKKNTACRSGPEDLDAHRLVLFVRSIPRCRRSTGWPKPDGGRAIRRRAVLEVNSIYAVLLAIRSGMGIGALPDYAVAENPDLVHVLTELKGPKGTYSSSTRRNCGIQNESRFSRDFLLARLAEMH